MFTGPEAVTKSMVADGLLSEDELGSLTPPVFFLSEATQRKVTSAL
jgi:hypothetical protein